MAVYPRGSATGADGRSQSRAAANPGERCRSCAANIAEKLNGLMFRFYGPEEAFYNKTFKVADVELVK